MDKDKILGEIFNNDPLGLLNVKIKTSTAHNEGDRLKNSFQEIIDFVEEHGKEPEANIGNVSEYQLYSRLKSIRADETKVNALEPMVKYNLLKVEKKEINSVDDIFNDDTFNLLGDDSEGLFDFVNVPETNERASTDFVARRKPCKNFEEYEPLFKAVQSDLKEEKRTLIKFQENQLVPGNYFVHNGMLLLLEEIHGLGKDKFGKDDGRTKVVFENGTQSNLKWRSLGKNLFSNGKGVTNLSTELDEKLQKNYSNITEEDEQSGYIYILKSKSDNDEIKSIKDLYKIGFTTTEIEERIRNAAKEPTYLMAPVSVVMAFQCYNMNTQKLERLLHTFFGQSCLNVEVRDSKGRKHKPREWFIAPIKVIERAVELIISREIIDYRYDALNQRIVEK
jgi:hypothetical protein